MKKNNLLIICFLSIIIIMFLLCSCKAYNNYSISLLINWGISVPAPDNVKVIYQYEGNEGEDFEIWEYNKSIHLSREFELLNEQNLESAIQRYEKYKEDMGINLNLQSKLKDNFDEKILSVGNYYCYKTMEDKPGCYVIMFYDTEENDLYYMSWIQ